MAAERQQTKQQLNIGALVQEQANLFKQFKTGLYNQQEAEFQKLVLDNGISYEAQIEYRKKQLAKERDAQYSDQEIIGKLKSEISNLNKLNRWQKWRDDFNASFEAYKLGRQTADNHLDFLEQKLNETEDPEMRDDIKAQILNTETQIRKDYRDTIDTRIKLAQQDGTTKVLNDAIKTAETEKAKAVFEKDELRSLAMDSALLTLKNQLKNTKIADDIIGIDMQVLGGADLDKKLDYLYNKALASDLNSGPIKIGSETFPNEQTYWQSSLNKFITDTYLSGKEKQFTNDLTSIFNKVGDIPLETLTAMKNKLNAMMVNPVLAPFADKVLTLSQNVLISGLDKKLNALNQKLQMDDTANGILNIKNEVDKIVAAVPEISQSAAYQTLELAFAKKQQEKLSTQLSTLTGAKETEIKRVSDVVDNMYAAGQMTDEEYQQSKSQIAKESSDVNLFRTRSSMTDMPLSSFGFNSKTDDIYNTVTSQYPTLSQPVAVSEKIFKQQTPATATAAAGTAEIKQEAKTPTPITENKPPAATPSATTTPTDPYASIRSVFGQNWNPAAVFSQRGLIDKGIYGAVRVAGTPDVYTIGKGGTKETAESYLQKFGSANQQGIVGEISREQAKQLGINI